MPSSDMSEIALQEHVLYALRNATLKQWPFPHFHVENVFPDRFYLDFQHKLDKKADYFAQEGKYAGRTFSNIADFPEFAFMQRRSFLSDVCQIFTDRLKVVFRHRKVVVYSDTRLVRDHQGYAIGPHTDAPWKLISLLFYCPSTRVHRRWGTSLYVPKKEGFTCPGGPHHHLEDFRRVATMPFTPNSCFGFFKSDVSFHGVETIPKPIRRDVLLYNVYDKEVYDIHHPAKQDLPASTQLLSSGDSTAT